jgi:predicted nucleotidyltransferase
MNIHIQLAPHQNELPQVVFLRELVGDIWKNPRVMAIWLGGSFAHGVADAHSDVDLRVGMLPDAFSRTQMPAGTEHIAASQVVQNRLEFGEDAVLFHTMLANGDIYDLFVQPITRIPSPEKRLVIACRDTAFAKKLESESVETAHAFPPAEARTIEKTLETFWLGQRKHVKVLTRGLQIVPYLGEQMMRRMVIQLCFIRATGKDCGTLERLTIHQATPVERAIAKHFGEEVWQILQADFSLDSLEHLQKFVAVLGRELATEWGFDYPVAAEETALHTWETYKKEAIL